MSYSVRIYLEDYKYRQRSPKIPSPEGMEVPYSTNTETFLLLVPVLVIENYCPISGDMENATPRVGGTATFTCRPGWHLSDERSHVVTCKEGTQTDGEWEPMPTFPLCKGTALLVLGFHLTVAKYTDVCEPLN